MTRINWERDVLPKAKDIVLSYSTGVTLRQLFYRLVADNTLPNTQSKYIYLSRQTAEGRRDGTFPELLDRISHIERWPSFDDVGNALEETIQSYRRDRTEGQPWNIYLGIEKAGLIEQLDAWLGEPLGIPILPLGGIASQSFCDEVCRDIERDGRPAVLIFAGDFDPTGEFLGLDFVERVGNFTKVERVALTERQVRSEKLVENTDPDVASKLEKDPRTPRFVKRHTKFLERYFGGRVVQFEVDALAPETLRNILRSAIDKYWDADAYEAVLNQEAADRVELEEIRDRAL